ncbi:hypothetical protein AAVH_30917 [Aphelenchoides avenae]|nr:hypothetical protein AAVH_30917 [Aphelenchus avenae]
MFLLNHTGIGIQQAALQRRHDVETLFTAAEVQSLREKDSKLLRAQLADEYEARILQLKAKHAVEKAAAEKEHAETLAMALQQKSASYRREGGTAHRNKVPSRRAQTDARSRRRVAEGQAGTREPSDEQRVRKKFEKELAEEKMKMEHEFRSKIATKDAEIVKLTGM